MTRGVLVTLALAALTTSCGGDLGYASSQVPKVAGAAGTEPVVEIPQDVRPDGQTRVKVLTNGSGPVIREGDVVLTNAEIRVWDGARVYLSTWGRQGQPTALVMDGRHVSSTWAQALIGKRVGSRVLLVVPASKGFGPGGQPPARLSASDTLVETFDIVAAHPAGAQVAGPGTYFDDRRLPLVQVAKGRAALGIPKTPAPGEPVLKILKKGDGPAIGPRSTVVTQTVGKYWQNAQTFTDSYALGSPVAYRFTSEMLPPGWKGNLDGVRQGSRVMLVVPLENDRKHRAAAYVIDVLDVIDGASG